MCDCKPGTCAREDGTIPAKTRSTFCSGRLVVDRTEPTIPRQTYSRWRWDFGTMKSAFLALNMEPVHDAESGTFMTTNPDRVRHDAT